MCGVCGHRLKRKGIGNENVCVKHSALYRVWLKLQRIKFIVSMLITCLAAIQCVVHRNGEIDHF